MSGRSSGLISPARGVRDAFEKVVMPMSSDSEDTKESKRCPRGREHQVEKPGHQRDGESVAVGVWLQQDQKAGCV